MTAENKHENENEPYGVDGRDGMDPLMAALLGEPLSEEARSDPAFMAGHRAATADVDLLREQLGVLADVLTRPAEAAETAAEPVRRPVVVPLRRPARRLLPLALKTVGVAAAGALVVGSGWLLVQVGRGANDIGASSSADKAAAQDEKSGTSGGTADSPLADPGYLACARLVVEGDVTDVVPVRGTSRERVTLHVTRSYKPQASAEASARGEVEFVMERDMDPLLAQGDHVLVGFARGSEAPDVWAVGEADIAAERSALARALPEADGMPCE
ncbi:MULTISPECIES: hypothetical protein [Streptomyces]|uniref:hypothetical protein n=1 Tax=Streptomyces TaxID=1883 RepID=UPI003722DCA4